MSKDVKKDVKTINEAVCMKLWIARDKDGTLCLFREKPTLDVYYWFDNSLGMTGCIAELLKTDFPEVTFENSPQKVEIKVVNYA